MSVRFPGHLRQRNFQMPWVWFRDHGVTWGSRGCPVEVGRIRYDSEKKLFVGNLSWTVDDESIGAKFSDLHGKVLDAKVTFDKESGRSCGFGFVTYSNAEEVNEAIQNLDGVDFDGRQMRVNLAGDKSPLRTCEF
ncbi:unnamed protein product [Sphagnum troendelagicum]